MQPLIATHMGYVTALDRDSGRVLWSHDVHLSAVPETWRVRTKVQLAVESPYVAVCTFSWTEAAGFTDTPGVWFYQLLCCDEQSGAVRWSVAGSAQGFGGDPAVLAFEPSLRIEQQRVHLSLQGVSAFTAEDGRLLWHSAVSPPADPAKPRKGWFGAARASEHWNAQLARRNGCAAPRSVRCRLLGAGRGTPRRLVRGIKQKQKPRKTRGFLGGRSRT